VGLDKGAQVLGHLFEDLGKPLVPIIGQAAEGYEETPNFLEEFAGPALDGGQGCQTVPAVQKLQFSKQTQCAVVVVQKGVVVRITPGCRALGIGQ
jgi:hypothetical protein